MEGIYFSLVKDVSHPNGKLPRICSNSATTTRAQDLLGVVDCPKEDVGQNTRLGPPAAWPCPDAAWPCPDAACEIQQLRGFHQDTDSAWVPMSL